MKIHEYQAKEIFAKYGIPIPKGIPAFSVDEAEAAAKKLIAETEQQVVVVKAQIHAGGRGKGGGVKVVKGATAAPRAAARRSSACSWSRTRPAPRARRCSACSSSRGSTSRASCTWACVLDRETRPRRRHGVDRGRHGHRGGRRARRPRRSSRKRSTRSLGCAGYQARKLAYGLGLHGEPPRNVGQADHAALDALFDGGRLLAARDQPAGRHQGRPGRSRSTPRSTSTTTRSFRHKELERAARLRRGGSGRDRSRRSGPQLHLARRQHRLHGQRRRPGDGDDGHHQALRRRSRRTSSTSAAAPPRSRSPRRSRSSPAIPKVKGIFVNIFGGIMKCDMIADGRHRRGQGGRPQGAARRAPRRHERRAGQEDARRERPGRSPPPTTWPTARRRSSRSQRKGRRLSHGGPRRKRHQARRSRASPARPGTFHAKQMRRVRHQRRRRRHARQGRRRSARRLPGVRHRRRGGQEDGRERDASSSCRRRAPPTRSSRRPRPASRVIVCITEGIPALRHGQGEARARARYPDVDADRPELPGRDHARRVQDRHHARLHPQGRARSASCRARGTLTYEAVGQLTDARPRPVDRDRHRRRSGQGHRLHRRASSCSATIRRPRRSS